MQKESAQSDHPAQKKGPKQKKKKINIKIPNIFVGKYTENIEHIPHILYFIFD